MRGLTSNPDSTPKDMNSANPQYDEHNDQADIERPEMEALTPPEIESLTPVGSPQQDPRLQSVVETSDPTVSNGTAYQEDSASLSNHTPDIAKSLIVPHQYSPPPGMNGTANKKRKLEQEFDQYDGGDLMGDLDEDVAELLRQEGGNG